VFEIGNSLREARLRRQVDFAQAELATKVRGKYLRALEEEQFDLLPAQTYVKGFLRTYAEYLGLDGQLYVDEYNSRFVSGEDSDFRRKSSVKPQRRNRRIETNVVLIALALIAIVTIVVISAWNSGKPQPVPTIAKNGAAAPRAYHPAPLLWIRAARGDSHLAVHDGGASGRLRYEGTLMRGQTQTFAGRRLWLAIDSPENLTIKVHGKLVHVPGRRPQVIVVTSTGWRPASA
jgi:cytoskeleton protein RodZ